MTNRLCQIIAIEKGVKNKVHNGTTEAYHTLQKPALMQGISRSYQPKDEEGEVLPPEQTKVQVAAGSLLNNVRELWTDLFDVTATKDYANCVATADVVVGDVVIAKAVPVTYLLFLEKKLADVHTFISKLPVLDASETWKWDANAGCYASEPVTTHRSKKVPKVVEKAKATDKHPAQVEVFQEDVTVGYWKTVKFSGALPADEIKRLLTKVESLQKAVKFAREEANSRTIEEVRIGAKIFSYLLG